VTDSLLALALALALAASISATTIEARTAARLNMMRQCIV